MFTLNRDLLKPRLAINLSAFHSHMPEPNLSLMTGIMIAGDCDCFTAREFTTRDTGQGCQTIEILRPRHPHCHGGQG